MIDFSPGFTNRHAFFKEAGFKDTLKNFFNKEIRSRMPPLNSATGKSALIGAGLGGATGAGVGYAQEDTNTDILKKSLAGAAAFGALTPFIQQLLKGSIKPAQLPWTELPQLPWTKPARLPWPKPPRLPWNGPSQIEWAGLPKPPLNMPPQESWAYPPWDFAQRFPWI